MAKCHQCFADVGAGKRSGKCTICYCPADVELCQRCAMWEFGPVDTVPDMTVDLRRKQAIAEVSRQDQGKPTNAVSTLGEEPLACETFLRAMGEACPFLQSQLNGGSATLYEMPFNGYACKVIDKFQALYPTCKYDRLALQVLLILHLSSQERVQCRDVADRGGASTSDAAKPLKRWQTRTLARAHLVAHLDDLKAKFGDSVHAFLSKPSVQTALGSNDLEFFLKGVKHPTLMAIDLLSAAGSSEAARETLEVGLVLYHSLTATRSRSEVASHWVARVNPKDFTPKDALGFVSAEHFAHLYGDVGEAKALAVARRAELSRLWNVLGDSAPENALPAHPRFGDPAVASHALLDDAEKAYLQYLPVFDHEAAERASRTACEQHVRSRVVAALKQYRASHRAEPDLYQPLGWTSVKATRGTTKRLGIKDQLGGTSIDVVFRKAGTFGQVSTTLDTSETDNIDAFLDSLVQPDVLRARGKTVYLEVSGEEAVGDDPAAQQRRMARRDAVEAAVQASFGRKKKPYSVDPRVVPDDGGVGSAQEFVDDLCARMRAEFCVDQAFDVVPAQLILDGAGRDQPFTPKAWFPLKTSHVKYAALLPDCGFHADLALETVVGHYEAVTGSSPRPAHYMDWRNHKDHWLYDCFAIAQTRRPLFGSLSTQPFLPAPNPNYGGHIIFYARPPLASRCVFTFGDKHQPRRSMLLLLDTILFARDKKDRSPPEQSAEARQMVLYDLVQRRTNLIEHADKTPEALWAMTFEGKKIPYPTGDYLIECHVFGGIDLARDAWAFVPACDDASKDAVKPSDLAAARADLARLYPRLRILPYEPLKYTNRQSSMKSKDARREAVFKDVVEAGSPAAEED